MANRTNHRPKDGFQRDKMYSLRMPNDLAEWVKGEAARRTALTGKKVSSADLMIEALRKLRTAQIWKRGA